MAFVPFNRKMVRMAASSEPGAQAKSLPFMSLVDASSMQQEDDEPEQMMRELSIGDPVQTENFNQNNVQQVLLKHLHLQLTELNATSGCLLGAPRREGTRWQYPRQYQNPFAPHLFTNISPTLYIFCLISFLFGGGTVLFFF